MCVAGKTLVAVGAFQCQANREFGMLCDIPQAESIGIATAVQIVAVVVFSNV